MSLKILAAAGCCLALFAGPPALAQTLRGDAAFGNWRADHPGVRRLIQAQDLPPVSAPTDNGAHVVPGPPGARPQVPEGFVAERVPTSLQKPRVIRVAP